MRKSAIPDLVAALSKRGFRFGSARRNPWGFLSDASFMPFHSPDGNCNVDLHAQPDSYPLHFGLDTLKWARLAKALETTACLLRGFGTPSELLPDDLGRSNAPLVQRLLIDWRQQAPPTLIQRLQREWLLAAEPAVAAKLMWRRTRGLLSRGGGMPVGLDSGR